ncbi:MAG: ABC transporter ATP-binding protein [Polyangiaceae bacterium]|nr:ABC transporter ATP-binding protein [Polyangiaceae bacterium]
MIVAEELTKDYGTVVAVRSLSFQVGRGEVVGFLGPNGAGKSTTLRMLAGFLGPTSGRARINGFDVLDDSIRARRSLGYMPESSPLYGELRVREYLEFRAALKQVPGRERRRAVDRALSLAAVADMAEVLVRHLSKGYRQRVGLADALVASPPLLILDEPTAGLDPNQIREVRKLVRALAEEHTLLLSTHILPEVESVCSRALVIHRGRLVAQGTLDELRAQRRARSVQLVVRAAAGRAKSLLERVEGAAAVRERALEGGELVRLVVDAVSGVDAGELAERALLALHEASVPVREARPVTATLEDVFAELTGAEREAAA